MRSISPARRSLNGSSPGMVRSAVTARSQRAPVSRTLAATPPEAMRKRLERARDMLAAAMGVMRKNGDVAGRQP